MTRAPLSIRVFVGLTVAACAFDLASAIWYPAAPIEPGLWPTWIDVAFGFLLSALFVWLIAIRRSESARVILLALFVLAVLLAIWTILHPEDGEPLLQSGAEAVSFALGLASVVPLLLPSARRFCREPKLDLKSVFD